MLVNAGYPILDDAFQQGDDLFCTDIRHITVDPCGKHGNSARDNVGKGEHFVAFAGLGHAVLPAALERIVDQLLQATDKMRVVLIVAEGVEQLYLARGLA